MSGFFTKPDIEAFVLDLNQKMHQLAMPLNEHLMLCDVRGMKIQTQDIVTSFAGVVGHSKFRSKRLAFVTGSSLSRMQAKRLTTREGVSYFSDIVEAEAWLFHGSDM